MSYITTYTGNHFDPINPDPELINIVDIAHALPMICRGNGQVSTFWSVGEHCILCAKEAAARGYSNRVIEGALLLFLVCDVAPKLGVKAFADYEGTYLLSFFMSHTPRGLVAALLP